MNFNIRRRTVLQKLVQYSASALALVFLSAPIATNIVQAQNTTVVNKAGIKTKVVRLAYQTSGDIVKIKGVIDKRLQPLGIKVEWSPFPAGPQLMEAMNANRVDIGSVGETPPIFIPSAQTLKAYRSLCRLSES